jgi:hypothetical protein
MSGVPIAAPRASDFSSGHGVFFLIHLRLVQPDMCHYRRLFAIQRLAESRLACSSAAADDSQKGP